MNTENQPVPGFCERMQAWSQQEPVRILALIALVLLAYQPAWQAGFIWDDDVYVTRNPLLTAPDGLRRIWFSTDSPSQYCPLVYTSFRFERPFWGLNAAGYHLVNILLHAVNGVLVWQVLRRLAVPGAWLAAALFALHPVQVESVAWISERKNVLSLLFYLLSLRAWIDFVEERAPKPWRQYALSLVFYVLALCSKTTACTLPAALVLLLWLKHQPLNRKRWAQILPYVALGLAMGSITMWWERYHQGTAGKLFAMGWLERVLLASRAVWFYLGKLIWPVDLMFSYPRWVINPAAPAAYAWLGAAGGATALVFWLRERLGRGLETGLLFFVATLGPLLGFIMLYTFRFSFVADHYQYIACIGPLALVAAGLAVGARALVRSKPGMVSLAMSLTTGCVLLGILGTLTWRQSRLYADAETLWRTTIMRNPESYLARNNLGTLLLRRGVVEPAIAQFKEVMRLQPDYEVAYYNCGMGLLRQGDMNAAAAQFQKAIELKPDYAAARNNLANICLTKGQFREAKVHYESAVTARPRNADMANNLAWLLATCADPGVRNGPKAVELARRSVSLSGGNNAGYLGTLAAAYAEAGQFTEARQVVQRALVLALREQNPALAEALTRQMALYQTNTAFHQVRQIMGPASVETP